MSQGRYWGLVHGVKSVSHVKSGRRETRTAGCISVLPLESTTCILTMNHDVGSSGSMEGTIMAEIFSQSVEKHKLKYSRFIGDGDTNIFRVVSESKASYMEKM